MLGKTRLEHDKTDTEYGKNDLAFNMDHPECERSDLKHGKIDSKIKMPRLDVGGNDSKDGAIHIDFETGHSEIEMTCSMIKIGHGMLGCTDLPPNAITWERSATTRRTTLRGT